MNGDYVRVAGLVRIVVPVFESNSLRLGGVLLFGEPGALRRDEEW